MTPKGTSTPPTDSPAPSLLGRRRSPGAALARTLAMLVRAALLSCALLLVLSLLPGLAAGVTVAAARRLLQRTRRQRVLGYIGGLVSTRGAAAETLAFRLAPLLLSRWRARIGPCWTSAGRSNASVCPAHSLPNWSARALGLACSLGLCLEGPLSFAACAAALAGLRAFQEAFRYVVIDLAAANTEGLALSDLLAILTRARRGIGGGAAVPRPCAWESGRGCDHYVPRPGPSGAGGCDASHRAGERVALVEGEASGRADSRQGGDGSEPAGRTAASRPSSEDGRA